MTIATGKPKGAKPKLSPEQVRQLRERNFLYMRLRLEAAKHSVDALAREFGVCRQTINDYLNRPNKRAASDELREFA